MGSNLSTYFALTTGQEKYLFWLESTKALRLESLEMGCGDLLVTKPNFKEMGRAELRKYIVQTHDEDAIHELFINRSDPHAKVYPYEQTQEELGEILKQKIAKLEPEH